MKPLRIQLQEKSPTFDELKGFQKDALKFERTQIHFFKGCFDCCRRPCCLSSVTSYMGEVSGIERGLTGISNVQEMPS